jgi:hypothetical protein
MAERKMFSDSVLEKFTESEKLQILKSIIKFLKLPPKKIKTWQDLDNFLENKLKIST